MFEKSFDPNPIVDIVASRGAICRHPRVETAMATGMSPSTCLRAHVCFVRKANIINLPSSTWNQLSEEGHPVLHVHPSNSWDLLTPDEAGNLVTMPYKRGIIVLISIFLALSLYTFSSSSVEAAAKPNMKRSMVRAYSRPRVSDSG